MDKIDTAPAVIAVAQAMHAAHYPEQDWLAGNTDEERAEWLVLAESAVTTIAELGNVDAETAIAAVVKLGNVKFVVAQPSSPVERKVTWAAAGAAIAALGVPLAIAGLEWAQTHVAGMPGVPPWAAIALTICAPPLLSWLGGYAAPHTERPDLGADEAVVA